MSNPQPGSINHLRTLREFEDSLKSNLAGFPPEVRDADKYDIFLKWADLAEKEAPDDYFKSQSKGLVAVMQHRRSLYVSQQGGNGRKLSCLCVDRAQPSTRLCRTRAKGEQTRSADVAVSKGTASELEFELPLVCPKR